MSRTWTGVGLAAVVWLSWAGAAQAGPLALADALAVAYDTNPQLAAQRASLKATDEGVAKANGGWRPSVSAQGTYGDQDYHFAGTLPPYPSKNTTHPLQGQVTLTQPVFRGGRTWAEIAKANALVRAGRAQLDQVEQNVLLAAATAYMDVVRDSAIVDLQRHNVEVLEKQLKATELQFKVGDLTKTDVAQARARLAGAQSSLVSAEGQFAVSRANYEQVIGRPAETLTASSPLPKLPASLADAEAVAEKQSPVLIVAEETERAADHAVDDSVGALLPQVSIQAQYGYSGAQSFGGVLAQPATTSTSLMAELTVPLYQGGSDEADIRQAKQLHSQSQLNVVTARRQVQDSVRGAWETFQSAQATIGSNKAQLTANELAHEGVQREQAVGARTVLDVLNAEQELLNAQVALVTSERDAEVAAYQLLAATGQLTARNLGLKVKLYDPEVYYDDNAARWIGFGD
ncbi:MAG: TolC family outer membrane protein [Alphaproteobacteria bacterium]|nr:TolC family outer membrane protein [Alphaproteobacteria bacterium]MBU6472151.1 TolC family outer membrane protein [Alphaproteobacteria bacterium]MDE2011765.1 TolC family outer membrane protein [Alphaproteobacteria bacterium]